MDPLTDSLNIYRELAERYDQLGQMSMRDRFLMLAADAAYQAGQPSEAERLRQRLLQASRHHMLRPYNSFAEALEAPDVQTYLQDLRANYPLDLALQLLQSLQTEKATAVDQTHPTSQTPEPAPRTTDMPSAIPPTAPVIDLFGAPSSTPHPTWRPATPYPVLTEASANPAPPATDKPRGQPLPDRAPARGTGSPARMVPPARPLMAAPSPAPAERTLRQSVLPSHSPPQATPTPTPAEEPSGVWLNFILVGVVLMAGLVLTLFTLARPFLQ